MRIAIFGGAFNPVHREHVNLARAAVRELGLDKIIIMPTAVSPHKSGRLAADFFQRYEMCRLAFASLPQAEISNFELTRGGVSYSYLTCVHFAEIYKEAKRWFIIGADMLEDFPHWKRPETILRSFSLAACARENHAGFEESKARVESMFCTEVATIPYVGEKVSSTEIRTRAALDEDFDRYVNAAVGQYIKDNALYYLPELQGYKKLLTPERRAHTLRVAVMCAQNAARVNLSEKQAITMAALHDSAKNLPSDSPLLSGFIPPDSAPPSVIHQYSGAYVAEKRFKITDKTVLSAIACHTTGKENMSGADALLYLCDMLEEGRKFEGAEALRKIFNRDLKECLAAALSHQIRYLKSTDKPLDGETQKAYNYIKDKKND